MSKSSAPDKSKPPIAVVYPFFPHYREPVMRELDRHGRYDYLFVGAEKDAFDSIKEADMAGWDNFINAPCRLLGGRILLQKGLLKIAMRNDIDTVIYHGGVAWPSMWLFAIVAKLRGKRLLNWTHGWVCHNKGVGRVLRRILFWNLSDALLLYGHLAKSIGIDFGLAPERMHVIYNSLDVEKQKAARARVSQGELQAIRDELFEQADRPIVLCSTRLIPVRRLDLLLIALEKLKQDGHEVNLLLVGDGPEKEKLQTQAREADLSVHFYGACYDEDILAKLTMASNVTVAPGKVGLTAMQSLAFGTPVITHGDVESQMPEWEAIIPGKTGGLFDRDNVEDLAREIKAWTQTPFVADSTRHACYDIIDRFYHPAFQRIVIERALDGKPADDLFWMKDEGSKPSS